MEARALVINSSSSGRAVGSLLSSAGYRVDNAGDLAAGMAKLRRHYYDIVISIESPGNESWQTCQALRELSDAPIIVISPRASTETCVQAIHAGADYFLRKPCGPLEFLARVRSLRQRRFLRPIPALP